MGKLYHHMTLLPRGNIELSVFLPLPYVIIASPKILHYALIPLQASKHLPHHKPKPAAAFCLFGHEFIGADAAGVVKAGEPVARVGVGYSFLIPEPATSFFHRRQCRTSIPPAPPAGITPQDNLFPGFAPVPLGPPSPSPLLP